MKLLSLILICLTCHGQILSIPFTTSKSSGGGVTFTTVQHVLSPGCSGFSGAGPWACAVTVTSTTSGNLGIMCGGAIAGTGANTTSVPTGAGTWVHASNTFAEGNGAASYYGDCYYNTNLTGSVTSISFNMNGTTVNFITPAFVEVHRSSGSWAAPDASNGNFNSTCTACLSPTGISLTGTDYVYYWAGCSEQTTYTSTTGITQDFNDNQAFGVGPALCMNVSTAVNGTASYAQATFNVSPTSTVPVAAVAFK